MAGRTSIFPVFLANGFGAALSRKPSGPDAVTVLVGVVVRTLPVPRRKTWLYHCCSTGCAGSGHLGPGPVSCLP